MKIALLHKSLYQYSQSVILSPHLIRLHPAAHTPCTVLNYTLTINPAAHFINWQQDPCGNQIAHVVFPKPLSSLEIIVSLQLDFKPVNPFNFFLDDYALYYPFEYNQTIQPQLMPYLSLPTLTPEWVAWLKDNDTNPQYTLDFIIHLNQKVHSTIGYTIRHEPGIQTSVETLTTKQGSCRDMAILLMETLRHYRIAARFVSGYLVQLATEKRPQNNLALHAWVEAYLPGAGWIGLDPTSGLLTSEDHIPLCCTPESAQAAAIEGNCTVCKTEFTVEMAVMPLDSDAKDVNPAGNPDWEKITAVANEVDKQIAALDIRLTSGGEPTFTKTAATTAEWHGSAIGTEKREMAEQLLYTLKDDFALGGLLHFGQGKHYPGEEYPRWMLSYFWRKDAIPIWQNSDLLATSPSYPLTFAHAKKFMTALIQALNLTVQSIEAFEDPVEILREQNHLISAHELDYTDVESTQKFLHSLDDTVLTPTGLILPLHWDFSQQQWHSPLWKFRRHKLFLTYGDTAIGYRLPLDTLIQHRPNVIEPPPQRSPLDLLEPLPSRTQLKNNTKNVLSIASRLPTSWECTALGVSIKENRLYVFIPPLAYIEHYLALMMHIETAAASIGIPVFIEGYAPPTDPRIEKFSIVPDPGVIEINMPPADNWQNLSHNMKSVYSRAALLALTPEKYAMNGRKIAAGGGNHIVLGGKAPKDSPFLRNPNLLRSVITYFQHHPSLSYLFSGLFIGPTCQAPRLDEARNDMLHELEIALDAIPKEESDSHYWLVDRLLRNVMVDVTGNTHRAEICLDKLYSPDHMNGRLGLIEFRAFEMPPTAELNLLQHLLLRAIILRCSLQPYAARLIRWGTALHDKFMLPYYIWHDFETVLYDLQQLHIPLEPKWYNLFLENRFPSIGQITLEDIQLNLRFAAEPWPILGETVSSGATSRPVDSATERLQVEIIGQLENKYMVLCNGYPLPLHATTQSQHFIAGVRFKAWDLSNTLHPNLPAQKTLTFEVVDCSEQRVLGGCCYHVSDPSGKNYEQPPVNEREATTRLQSLFSQDVAIRSYVDSPQRFVDEEYPYTLDLRRPF